MLDKKHENGRMEVYFSQVGPLRIRATGSTWYRTAGAPSILLALTCLYKVNTIAVESFDRKFCP